MSGLFERVRQAAADVIHRPLGETITAASAKVVSGVTAIKEDAAMIKALAAEAAATTVDRTKETAAAARALATDSVDKMAAQSPAEMADGIGHHLSSLGDRMATFRQQTKERLSAKDAAPPPPTV